MTRRYRAFEAAGGEAAPREHPPAEFGACLLLQLELELDEFGVTATEDELAKAMDYMLTRWVAPVKCAPSLRHELAV